MEPGYIMQKLEKIMQAASDDVAWWVLFLLFAGAGASMLGLSMHLRNGGTMSPRAVIGALLHSMVWGVVVFLMGYSTLAHDLPMLLGLSILSGMGSASFADVVLMLVKNKLGINVTFNPASKTGPTRPGDLPH